MSHARWKRITAAAWVVAIVCGASGAQARERAPVTPPEPDAAAWLERDLRRLDPPLAQPQQRLLAELGREFQAGMPTSFGDPLASAHASAPSGQPEAYTAPTGKAPAPPSGPSWVVLRTACLAGHGLRWGSCGARLSCEGTPRLARDGAWPMHAGRHRVPSCPAGPGKRHD